MNEQEIAPGSIKEKVGLPIIRKTKFDSISPSLLKVSLSPLLLATARVEFQPINLIRRIGQSNQTHQYQVLLNIMKDKIYHKTQIFLRSFSHKLPLQARKDEFSNWVSRDHLVQQQQLNFERCLFYTPETCIALTFSREPCHIDPEFYQIILGQGHSLGHFRDKLPSSQQASAVSLPRSSSFFSFPGVSYRKEE